MSDHQKTILFWGPQCVYYWVRVFIVPAFEELKQYGWKTTYFFPPLNEYNIGVPLTWSNDFESSEYEPDLRVIEDPACSVFHINSDDRATEALKDEFKGQSPDIIVTRTHGHSYLKKLFPNATILSIADALGAPWFGRGTLCFTLTEDEFFYGNSFLSTFPEQALSIELPEKIASEGYRLMNVHEQLPTSQQTEISAIFDTLRRKYRKLYTIPVCAGMAETDYVYYAYDHQYMTQADIIYSFLANTDDDCALIITSHPFTPEPDIQENLMKVFAGYDRIIIADELDISPKIFTTANIMPLCDGMICWMSKAFWHALICEKPLFNYATHDIRFCKPYEDIKEWLAADTPKTSIEEILKLFYWSVTRYRIRVSDTAKLNRILNNFLKRPKDKASINQIPNVYEWLETETDYHAYFTECIDEIRAERGL